MIPGEIETMDGEIELNAGAARTVVTVANTGDRPIQVGSHYHFAETNPALSFDRAAARGQRLQTIDYDEVVKSKIIVGTPAMVTDRLGQLQKELGLSGILAELNCGMRIPAPQVLNSLQMMCSEVTPRFK